MESHARWRFVGRRCPLECARTFFRLRFGGNRQGTHPRPASVSLTLVCLFASPSFLSHAKGVEPKAAITGDSFVLRVKRVYPVSPDHPWVYEPGIVIVRGGRIEAVGNDLEWPPDLPLMEFPDASVTPGFIAAATWMISGHTGDESIAAGYRAVDAFDTYGDFSATLAGGVTTVHLSPGWHRLLTGRGSVVRLGGPPAEKVLQQRSDLTINLGEPAFRPPRDVTYRTPASSDVAIPPAVRQRPDSRLGQFLALEEALQQSVANPTQSIHAGALHDAWEQKAPLRIQVQRDADILGAIDFLDRKQQTGYLVGGAEAHVVADILAGSALPLVYTISSGIRSLPGEIGYDPDALDADISAISSLRNVKFALAGPVGGFTTDMRLAGATALRAGIGEQRVLEAMTRVPAEILGISDRVGSIQTNHSADLVVFSGHPLETSSHVQRVWIAGRTVFQAPSVDALVVRAGTIWIDEQTRIHNGAVLIEKGLISAVGFTVPHPPFSRLVDAGKDGFVTPGFIDAFGHLGLEGDRSAAAMELKLDTLVGAPDVAERRVAKGGVTTVITAPYLPSPVGSQVAAIRTQGNGREGRVVSSTAGVVFDFRTADPLKLGEKLKQRLEEGKKYLEKWRKYEKEFVGWKEKKAKGELPEDGDKKEEIKVEDKPDPITGTWALTGKDPVSGQEQHATMRMRLEGSTIEGRITAPGTTEEAKLTATFDGKHISGVIEVNTPMGQPQVEADLVEEDHIAGTIALGDLKIEFDARRTDKEAVEFKVARRRTHGKGGRPLPPPVDEALEPLRAVLEKKIPVVVAATTEAQIAEALKVTKEYEVELVLVGGERAAAHAATLVERKVGVVLPQTIVQVSEPPWPAGRNEYLQADDLSRRGVSVAFQSDGEDSARALRDLALHAVERGMSPDAALAAFTTQPSRMFKLEEKIGSLQRGRLGDLVIFNGHPFEAGTRIERVIIGGEEVK